MKKETQLWLDLTHEDYKDMQVMVKGKRWRGSVFFAQQTVEKILKAYIIEYIKEVPLKTHRIEKLVDEALIDLAEIGSPDVKELSKAYEWTRYADLSHSHFKNKQDVQSLLEMSEKIYVWIIKKFKNK